MTPPGDFAHGWGYRSKPPDLTARAWERVATNFAATAFLNVALPLNLAHGALGSVCCP
jgi:hypothetical protein